MTWGMVAVAGAGLVGGALSSRSQKKAGQAAAGAQEEAAMAGIEEQRRQFDAIQKLLAPYAQAGEGALSAQQGLLGLSGPEAQRAAIAGLEGSPQMAAMTQQGENAIRQNAAATGGLRGGNTQGALATFRPQLLSQLIQQQYSNLGGLTNIGQASAAGQANAAQQLGQGVSNAYGQIGQAQAGSALASGQAQANMWSGLGQTAGQLGTMKLLGMF